MKLDRVRCWKTDDPLFIKYHDEEWGTPVHDDRILFEFLVLQGFQAGVTWRLIMGRREALRKAFDGFDTLKIAGYTDADVERLMNAPGMIKNRRKILSVINNARRLREVQREFGSFDTYVWSFVGGKTIHHNLKDYSELEKESEEAKEMGRDMKRRGFTFVGPIVCYSFMQAVGMVNDHLVHCFRYRELKQATRTEK